MRETVDLLRANVGNILLIAWVLSVVVAGLLCLRHPVCGEALLEDLREFLLHEALRERLEQMEPPEPPVPPFPPGL